jgi:Na+/pantothenate symporter
VYWRCSITNHWTPGNSSTSSSPYQLSGLFTCTVLTHIYMIDLSWGLSIIQDTLKNIDTHLVVPWTSLVSWFMHCVVWKATKFWVSLCNSFWSYPECNSLKEKMGSLV